MTTDTMEFEGGLLATIMSDDAFWPFEPNDLSESGLPGSMIESLTLKTLAIAGTMSGRGIADHTCLPYRLIEEVLGTLRTRQLLVHAGGAAFNDYYYTLTDEGKQAAQDAMKACAYVGPAPVPLMDYVISVEAQSISAESPRRDELQAAFSSICVPIQLFEMLGPAVNSGAGMFLYGAPGNGKSTLAKRLTACFGQEIWIPHSIIEGGQIIKLYDPSYHQQVQDQGQGLIKAKDHDRRWIKIRRPTVIVGGELTMDNLEIRHDARSNVSEASLQLKSNGGCLLIDDFGRQRVAPAELLNRWIIPLENRLDYLTLGTGQKIQVPFDQLILFSTNLDPDDLVDEAFLRRIPYKIHITDPSEPEFVTLFKNVADDLGCTFSEQAVQELLARHYRAAKRPMRRCHPRDLMKLVASYCKYHDLPVEMRTEYFDRVIPSYFTSITK